MNDRKLSSSQVRSVVDDWVATGRPFLWSKTPEQVKRELLDETLRDGGSITYGTAMRVLRSAETVKMRGDANQGMGWIRDRWRLLPDFHFPVDSDPGV